MMSTFPAAAVGILLLLVLSRHHSKDPQLPIRFLVVRAQACSGCVVAFYAVAQPYFLHAAAAPVCFSFRCVYDQFAVTN